MRKVNNLGKIALWCFLFAMITSACSPDCHQVEHTSNTGSKVSISLVECGTSQSVFDLALNLSMISDPSSSSKKNEIVHIPSEAILLETHKELDYAITASRHGKSAFTIKVRLKEGNNTRIEGTKMVDPKPQSSAHFTSGPGWVSTFIFDGTISKSKNGVLQTSITSFKTNKNALGIFQNSTGHSFDNYSFILEISE